MTPSGPKPGAWQVHYLAAVSALLRFWFRQARDEGFSMLFEASFLMATHHLTKDPEEWGDPLFGYHKLGLTVGGHSSARNLKNPVYKRL